MHARLLVLLLCLFVAACETYWAFPLGKNHADFKLDEQHCYLTAFSMSACLSAKGYRQISREEMVRLNEEAAKPPKPLDVVAYEISSGDFFVGKSAPVRGSTSASIKLTGISSRLECSGYAEITKLVPGGVGSTGRFEMICKDGRKVVGDYVYETISSGFGRGIDGGKRAYMFLFGELDVDEDALREQFKTRQKQGTPV